MQQQQPQQQQQGITRHVVRVARRQVHYRHRRGDGSHAPAALLLHASPRSSAALLPLMQSAPPGLALFALDTPGFGLSAPLTHPQPGIEDFADALRDTMDALGITQAAVYGTHTGAAIGLALAVRHPQRVSTLVLDGVSRFSADELSRLLPAYVPPLHPQTDGSHLAWLWTRVRDQALFFPWNERCTGARLWRALPDAATLHAAALELLVASDYISAYAAALRCDGAGWIARLRVPALIGMRPDDVLAPHMARLGTPPPGVVIESLLADRAAADARLWAALHAGRPAMAAPPPAAATLPNDELGDFFSGTGLHVRGATGGSGRPRVLLHPSPGGPRSLEALLQRYAARRPAFAPSLPGHGDASAPPPADPAAMVDALERLLIDLGLDEDAEISGHGLTTTLAAELAARRPGAWRMAPSPWQGEGWDGGSAAPHNPPGPWPPRDDGGHLFAVWQHARDEVLLGPWWARPARHEFGDAIDVQAVHRHAIEVLKEAPAAAVWRAASLASTVAPVDRSAVKPLNPLE